MTEREQAETWWKELGPAWRRAFQEALLGQPSEAGRPDTDTLIDLISLETLRLAGPRAPYPNLSFELLDLEGVAGLRSLRFLSVTDMAITSLAPLASLVALEDLFVQDNRLASLNGIEGLTALKSLYCQGNRIGSLAPIERLTQLKTIYASGNRITRIDGLHAGHVPNLEQFFILPNERLLQSEVMRVQDELGIRCRQG